jgi:hypothetical protein
MGYKQRETVRALVASAAAAVKPKPGQKYVWSGSGSRVESDPLRKVQPGHAELLGAVKSLCEAVELLADENESLERTLNERTERFA